MSFASERPRLPLTVLVGLGILWGTVAVDAYRSSTNTHHVLILGVFLVVVPAAATWHLLGRTTLWGG